MTKLRIVDLETGEDKSADYTLRHRNQDAAYRRKGRQRDFTFGNMLNMPEVVAKIDDKYCGYLLYLQTYIDYDGSLSDRGEPLDKDDIQRVLGLGRSAFFAFMKAMRAGEIIVEKAGKHYVNQAYHFKGATSNKHVIKSFTHKVRKLYTVRSANKLGFIYKLLPYIHLETNTVCANPYEKKVEGIRQLSKADIAELTGVNEKTVYTYLRRMKLGDEFVFAEIRRGNTRYYKLNPFIFYRKQGEPDATLREMFRLGFSGR